MDKKMLVISTTAIIGFIFVSYFAFNKPTTTYFPDQAKVRGEVTNDKEKVVAQDHKKGNGKNVLIEYSDLQCPACKMFHEYIENEKKNDKEFAAFMDKEYTFIYRHFPLTGLHKNAEAAAYGAEAAAIQGKFYEFVDRAFATQSEWSEMEKPAEFFIKIARDLGLDEKKFTTDSSSDVVKKKVQADSELALKGQVNSTPTFFANGVKLGGYSSFDDFKKMLQDASKKE